MSWQFPYYAPGERPDWEQLEAKFSWLRDMHEVPQDPIWHAEGDVFIHTQMVVNQLLALPAYQALDELSQHILFAAALLHDVEKRSTTSREMIDGVERIVSPRHALKGEYTARQILYQDIPTPFVIREQICKLVRLHGLPLWAIEKSNPTKEVIRASLTVNTEHLGLLAKADVLGRISSDQEEMLVRIEMFEDLCRLHQCFGQRREFASDYGRYLYLNREEISPDYEPYDDLKFTVYVMSALPGCGKDTYIQRHLDLPILSLDDIRRERKIDPTDKKNNGRVIQMAKEKAKEWMRLRKSFVFNATNLTRDMRSRWISLFTDYGGRVKIIYLEVPYKQLMKQNHYRPYKVPELVIQRMIRKLEIPSPNEAHEIEYHVY